MSEPIQYMEACEFQQEGYLHEVNRRFLHPLGLALEARVPKHRLNLWQRFRHAAWMFLYGTRHGWVSGIWDYRDDPEGMNYGPDLLSETKASRIAAIEEGRRPERLEALGYWIQPTDADPQ